MEASILIQDPHLQGNDYYHSSTNNEKKNRLYSNKLAGVDCNIKSQIGKKRNCTVYYRNNELVVCSYLTQSKTDVMGRRIPFTFFAKGLKINEAYNILVKELELAGNAVDQQELLYINSFIQLARQKQKREQAFFYAICTTLIIIVSLILIVSI